MLYDTDFDLNQPYHYTSCGLDHVYLTNGFECHETLDGSGVSIHALDELHQTIAMGIVTQRIPITSKEFRFLRIELDLSQKTLGSLMGKTDQMVAKWEKGESKIPVLADKAIRDLYVESIGESHIAGLLAELKDLDNQVNEIEFQLSETESGWSITQQAQRERA